MSSIKTKTELGRHYLSATAALKIVESNGQVSFDRSGQTNRLWIRDGAVTFAPYSVPGWRQLIARRANATTNMTGNRLTISDRKRYQFTDTSRDYYGRYLLWVGSGDPLVTYGSIPTMIGGDPNAVAQAAEKFVQSILDATHDIRGASILAEVREAISGLASPAKALRHEVGNLYQTARRRLYRDRNRSIAAMRDVVAGTWLEWQFGLKPTIQDATDAAAALNKLRTRDLIATYPVRGKAREAKLVSIASDINFPSATIPPGFSTIPATYNWHAEDWQTAEFRGMLKLPVNPGAGVPLAMRFGVDLPDVVPAIWEAIPWSWFVDYFVNVSSVIDAWSVPLSSVAWANRTVRNGRTHHFGAIQPQPSTQDGPAYRRYTASGGNAKATLHNVTRSTVLPTEIRPPLRIKIPGVGSTKWANIAALASYGTDLAALRRSLNRYKRHP